MRSGEAKLFTLSQPREKISSKSRRSSKCRPKMQALRSAAPRQATGTGHAEDGRVGLCGESARRCTDCPPCPRRARRWACGHAPCHHAGCPTSAPPAALAVGISPGCLGSGAGARSHSTTTAECTHMAAAGSGRGGRAAYNPNVRLRTVHGRVNGWSPLFPHAKGVNSMCGRRERRGDPSAR